MSAATVAGWRRAWLTRWLVQRLVSGVLVLWVVSFIVFLATEILPGNPAQAILGHRATPELVRNLSIQLGLNRPVLDQYWDWTTGVLRGDFGVSLASQQPVTSVVGSAIANSAALLFVVAAAMVVLSGLIGVTLAVRRDSLVDRVVNAGFIGSMALPDFIIGTLALIVLSTSVLHVFPAASLIPPGTSPFAEPQMLALPAITLLITTVPFIARLVRASVIEALNSDYVAMARLRGVPERTVVWRHALPNSVVPAIQGTAMTMGYLLGGDVIVEYVFNYPGLGGLLNQAIAYRDLPLIQAITLIFTAGVVFFNMTADVLTVTLTPKLRTKAAG